MRWRYALRGLMGLMLLGVVAGVGVIFTLGTPPGVRLTMEQLHRLLPGSFSYTEVRGDLLRGLYLHDLHYRTTGLDVRIARVALRLYWPSYRALEVGFLRLDGVRVRTQPQPDQVDTPPSAWPAQVTLPVGLAVRELRVRDMQVQVGEGAPVIINRLDAAASLNGSALVLSRLAVTAPSLLAGLSGQLTLAGDWPLQATAQLWPTDLSADTKASAPEFALTATGSLLDTLELRLRSSLPGLEGKATVQEVTRGGPWRARLALQKLELMRLWPPAGAGVLSGTLEGEGEGARAKLTGQLQLDGDPAGVFHATLQAQSAPGRLRLEQLRLDGPLGAELEVSASLEDGQRLQGAARWAHLAWPLSGPAQVVLPRGTVLLDGRLDAWDAKLDTRLLGPQIPVGDWQMQVQGDRAGLRVSRLAGTLLGGSVQGTAGARWAPDMEWQFELSGQGLNPGREWRRWPGQVAFDLTGTGAKPAAGDLALAVQLRSLGGNLRGHALGGKARGNWQGGRLELPELVLRVGDATLTAQGEWGDRAMVRARLHAPQLATLAPGLAGAAEAQLQASGTPAAPAITGTVRATQLRAGSYGAQRLEGNLDVDLGTGDRLNLQLTGTGISGLAPLTDFALASTGRATAHAFNASASGPDGELRLAGRGSLRLPRGWEGQLREARVGFPATPWTLRAPVALAVNTAAVELGQLCLGQRGATACAQGSYELATGAAAGRARIEKLDLTQLSPWLPPDVALQGELGATATAAYQSTAPLDLDLRVQAGAGQVVLTMAPDEPPLSLAHGGLNVQALAGAQGTTVTGRLAGVQAPPLLDLKLALPPLPVADPAKAPITGTLQGEFTALHLVEALVPALTRVNGRLTTDLRVNGTLTEPRVAGAVRLREGKARVLPLGINLHNAGLELNADGQGGYRLDGAVDSGDGRLTVAGQGRLNAAQGWPVELTLRGENFKAAALPEALVIVNPDLRLSYAAGGAELSGAVVIPRARLEPRLGGGGVVASPDAVIVAPEQPPRAEPVRLSSEVRVELGQQVQVTGYGFDGRLAGTLRITDVPGQPTAGSGAVDVVQGRYKAYGQDLAVERGRVIFSGPLDNPGLDLLAVRKVDTVRAGLRVQGTALKPEMTLYSEPPMPQDQALAYVLLGRPLGQASAQEGSMLASAATALGLSRGELLARRIGQRFGLDEVSLDSGSGTSVGGTGTTGQSLLVGKYLSPRLYVGYGVGLFDQTSALRMRLRLSEHWLVQVLGGQASAGDLLYTLER